MSGHITRVDDERSMVGVVGVTPVRFRSELRAACSCDWRGPYRAYRPLAEEDAQRHRKLCDPAEVVTRR